MPKKEVLPVVPMRVLRIRSTPSLSGRSELTYQVGCNTEGEIHFRVVKNTGSGQFNSDWVALLLIETLLSEHPATKPMTSGALRSVFRHRSSNSPAFLLAALKAESLVLPGETKDSGYHLGDFLAFRQAMSALIAIDTNLNVTVTVSPEVTKRKRSKENA
ncbi:hypothetical protein [Azonexus sp.]|uniref:hypothetical protein n=1 Tax=Azonexus sp. TaxID=1872668 RepID=UPI0035B10830